MHYAGEGPMLRADLASQNPSRTCNSQIKKLAMWRECNNYVNRLDYIK